MKSSMAPACFDHAAVRWAAVVVLLAGALLLGHPNQAGADTRQPDGPPDKGFHSWCYLSNFNQQTAADAAVTRLRNQTAVDTLFPGSCREHTDVRWRQGSLPGYGRAECRTRWASNNRCDTYNVTLYMNRINNAQRPINQRSKTSCHELGHTVGVRHYSGTNFPGGDTAHSCMRSGEVTSAWTNITRYGHHHRTRHINPWFS